MNAAEILKLIETVSPDDTAMLDEIDARVFCFLRCVRFISSGQKSFIYMGLLGKKISSKYTAKYTRSRDALKAIRPEGWQYRCVHDSGSGCWNVSLTKWGPNCTPKFRADDDWRHPFKTEELSELHAIIQAIEYERTRNPSP